MDGVVEVMGRRRYVSLITRKEDGTESPFLYVIIGLFYFCLVDIP